MGKFNPLSWFDPKKRAIRRYFKDLPPRLLADYGHTGPYTPEQVHGALARYRIGPKAYAPYALAMFCEAKVLARIPGRFAAIRRELGAEYFNGDSEFSYFEVRYLCAHAGGYSTGDSHGGVDLGGAHHGGHH